MDFSGSTDFYEDLEDNIIIPRPLRPIARTPKVTYTLPVYSPINNKNEPYFKLQDEIVGLNIYNIRLQEQIVKKNKTAFNQKAKEFIYKDDPIPDVRNRYPRYNNSSQETKHEYFNKFPDFDNFFKGRFRDTRIIKLGKYHNRCQTACFDNAEKGTCLGKRIHNNIKFMKKVLIPQTKANNVIKNQSPSTGLKVKGIIIKRQA
ncbi:hypothetical protein SteCoe_16009 [Stentor coeruleus]|uniref:Uncharacterized protein n=1 Tax=Stentor coeruleus TaxID=5963 RepID=A0A1R2C2J3_9CILI|nr:hypothetical protein SteCoe_16009 [Stentor coeruleus]